MAPGGGDARRPWSTWPGVPRRRRPGLRPGARGDGAGGRHGDAPAAPGRGRPTPRPRSTSRGPDAGRGVRGRARPRQPRHGDPHRRRRRRGRRGVLRRHGRPDQPEVRAGHGRLALPRARWSRVATPPAPWSTLRRLGPHHGGHRGAGRGRLRRRSTGPDRWPWCSATRPPASTARWSAPLDARVTIPMAGRAESLNVGVSAAVVCFEALRQRRAAAGHGRVAPARSTMAAMDEAAGATRRTAGRSAVTAVRCDVEALVAEARRPSPPPRRPRRSARWRPRSRERSRPWPRRPRALGSMDPAERKELGRQLHEARATVDGLLETRRAEIRFAERSAEMAASPARPDRVHPRVGSGTASRGHLHLVSQTRDALEDVFVGMGFEVAEGPEIETDWYNFGALNIPPAHPARGMWDTFYLDLGAPESTLLRTHTSPVQIHLMERAVVDGTLPIHAVMPGRCYRRDTPDARHLAVFHQIEGLVVDRGITFADLAGTIETFTTRLLRPRHPLPAATGLLPLHRAVGRVRGDLHHLPGRRLPDVLADRVDRARRMRHGRPGGVRARSASTPTSGPDSPSASASTGARRCGTRSPTCGPSSRTTSASCASSEAREPREDSSCGFPFPGSETSHPSRVDPAEHRRHPRRPRPGGRGDRAGGRGPGRRRGRPRRGGHAHRGGRQDPTGGGRPTGRRSDRGGLRGLELRGGRPGRRWPRSARCYPAASPSGSGR